MPEGHGDGGWNFSENGRSVLILKACSDGAIDKAFTKAKASMEPAMERPSERRLNSAEG